MLLDFFFRSSDRILCSFMSIFMPILQGYQSFFRFFLFSIISHNSINIHFIDIFILIILCVLLTYMIHKSKAKCINTFINTCLFILDKAISFWFDIYPFAKFSVFFQIVMQPLSFANIQCIFSVFSPTCYGTLWQVYF